MSKEGWAYLLNSKNERYFINRPEPPIFPLIEKSSEKKPDSRIFSDDFFEKMNKLFEEHLLKKQGAGSTKDHFEPRQPCKICKHINIDEGEYPCNECRHNPHI